jgi:hypothetical protein
MFFVVRATRLQFEKSRRSARATSPCACLHDFAKLAAQFQRVGDSAQRLGR